MFNLIYVGNYCPQIGGAAISCHQLMAQLARLGCRCRVLASITRQAEVETLSFDASQGDIELERFHVPFYFNAPYNPPPPDWEEASHVGVRLGLERMIADLRPDVLLLREGWVPYANETAVRHGIPRVALVRGNPTRAILRESYPKDLGRRFLTELGRVDRIVTVGRHFLAGLAERGIHNAQWISNSVDLKAFSPRPRDLALAAHYGIEPSDIVVLHAGHIKPIKRPFDIVYSAATALRSNSNLLYFFVGEGEHRQEIEELAGRLGLTNRFRFERFVDYSLMPRYLNLADLVIVASEAEGLARTYLETQACAKTLVASDIPAANEVVSHGQTGLLFRKGDADDLAEKTLLAAGDINLRAAIGRRSLERVKVHDAESIARQYLDLFKEITRGGGQEA